MASGYVDSCLHPLTQLASSVKTGFTVISLVNMIEFTRICPVLILITLSTVINMIICNTLMYIIQPYMYRN